MQNFFREAPKLPFGIFLLCECRGYDYPGGFQGHVRKNLQNFTQIYAISVLSVTSFKVILFEIC